MSEPLNQDEINSLLSSAFGNKEYSKIEKRRKLYQEFLKNNKSFNSEILMNLIDLELKNRQNAGHDINLDYMKNKIPKDYANKKTKELGYGLWWGGESEWYIVAVKDFTINSKEKGSINIKAACIMEYISSHVVYGRDKPMQKEAFITMKMSDKFVTEEFVFSWNF